MYGDQKSPSCYCQGACRLGMTIAGENEKRRNKAFRLCRSFQWMHYSMLIICPESFLHATLSGSKLL